MKTLFKKACTLTIATALSLCAVPFQTQNIINSVMAEDSDYLTTESGLYYKINNDEIIITGCDDKLKDITIPSEIDGLPVTAIGESAFTWKSQLNSVVISEGIRRIEYCGFSSCRFLTSVKLPQSLEYIGENGFDGCDRLKDIEIPPKVTVINRYAFRNCAFETLEIPDTVTSIREYAFSGCSEMTEVSISQNINVIEKQAFESCYMLQYVIVPYGVERIEQEAFSRCTSLKAVFLPESLSYIGKEAFNYCNSLKEIELPDSISEIDDSVFYDTGITEINLPENLQYLGNTALPKKLNYETENGIQYYGNWAVGCDTDKDTKSLTVREGTVGIASGAFSLSYGGDINIPSTVEYIGNNSFKSAYSNIQNVNVSEDNKYFCSSDGILYSKDMSQLICYPAGKDETSFDIPETVSEISAYAFYENKYLTSVNFPDSVKYIDDYAFSYCKGFTELSLPSGLLEIGKNAFANCSGFEYQYKLDIPDSVTKIGENAFASSNMYITRYTENNSNIEMVDDWIVAGDDFFKSQEINFAVRGIADGAYKEKEITDLVLPDEVEYIGESAFQDCRILENINLPQNIVSIDDKAFMGCENVDIISIPDSVSHIGKSAFEYCYKTVRTSDGIDYADRWAVGADNTMKSLSVREGTRGIAESSFYGCTELETVQLPEGLCFINDEAFELCIGIKHTVLPESLLAIDKGAFAYCITLDEITIPENVLYTDFASFFGCEKLNKITFMNPETIMYPSALTIDENAVIYGYRNSFAQKYATLFKREFVALDGDSEEVTGDANGDGNIDIADVVAISSYVANPEKNTLSEQSIINSDVQNVGDGLTANDALAIQQYLANIITSLPV